MKNRTSVWAYILVFLGYFYGTMFCLTLFLIPLGIYIFSGAIFYQRIAALDDVQLLYYKDALRNWAIFYSIILFPIGLLSIIPYKIATSNNIRVTSTEQSDFSQESKQSTAADVVDLSSEPVENNNSSNLNAEAEQVVVSEENMQKFLQLKKYHDDGLITDGEYERAKDAIFGKTSKFGD